MRMRSTRPLLAQCAAVITVALVLSSVAPPANAAILEPDGAITVSPSGDLAADLQVAKDTTDPNANPGTAVAYSPDGATMAVGGEDGQVLVYRAATGELLSALKQQVGAAVSAVAFSPAGDLLASAGRDSTIAVWKTSDWSLVRKLDGHEQAATSLAFTPDGTELVTGGEDTRTLVWKVSNGKLQDQLGGATGFITSLAVSPDGSTLATGTADDRIILRNAKTKKRLETLRGHAGEVTGLAFSPDSKTLLSGSADKTAKLWNVAKGTEKRTLRGSKDAVSSVAFSPNGKTAAVAGADGTIRMWNPADGMLRTKFGKSGDKVAGIAFSPNGKQLAEAGEDGSTVVYGTTDGAVKRSTKLPKRVKKGKAAAGASASASAAVVEPAAFAPTAIETPPGGPILVVTNSGDPYSTYYTEILRAEGLNQFATADLGSVTAASLANYQVVLLGRATLTTAQVTTFTNWVNGGGNLVAFRPDSKLAGLLGLTTASGTLSEGYLKVDTSTSPGNGIVSETIQFHGTADRYTVSGARSVATLYNNATTATSNPAVTTRSVGSSGGDAAAFTYDLARSIVYTRQGNPAWAGQERDGIAPKRSDDLYYGAASGDNQTDWINLSKVEIPQADEQQRLLVNLINEINANKMPLPRFWYLPKGLKAAVVMTGDDHANGGTVGRFNQFDAASPANCSVADWECYRGTSYIFPNTPMTNSQAAAFAAKGFEIGLHVTTSCADFTPASLAAAWDTQLASWQGKYTSLPKPVSNRTHCLVWSDWSTMASESRSEGVRMDTNYYYWPPGWIQNRPGFFTGSGIPMRFTDSSGAMLDIYQAASQMTDESGQSYPYTIDTLLDNALGAKQYFGAFTINAHTDANEVHESTSTLASAKARGVPLITAKQLLDWTDGRNSSSFQNLAWAGNKLTFTVAQGTGARNLTMLVPARANGQAIGSITRAGSPVSYQSRTVKGADYALVTATAGSYEVTYASDTTAPTVTATSPADGATGVAQGATLTATFSEPLNPATVTSSSVELRTSADALVPSTVSFNATTNQVQVAPTAGLAASSTYRVTIKGGTTEPVVRDLAGNALATSRTWTFTTAAGPTCPCSIWASSATPTTASQSDPNAVELGVKFRSDVAGYVTGIRFYKGAQNTGTHTGNLWTTAGAKLASAVFSGETASGWQTVTFSSPVQITANTTYVASYHTTSGYYAVDNNFFTSSGVDRVPLHALQSGVSGDNGVYAYGASQFPNQSWLSSNYWVDVVFSSNVTDTTPPTVTTVAPAADATGVAPSTAVTGTFSEAMNASTISTSTVTLTGAGGAAVSGTVTYNTANQQVTFQPSSALSALVRYTATIKGGSSGVKDAAGNALAADRTWSFTIAAADTTAPTVTAVSPAAGATGVSTAARPTATFSEALNPSTVSASTVTLTGPGTTAVPSSVSFTSGTNQIVIQPTSALAGSTTFTATVKGGSSGVKDLAGNALAVDRVWTFTTAAATPEPTKHSIWPANAVPGTVTDPDGGSVELGVKFQADVAGSITGIRFYKGPQNTGTHTGTLWSATGTQLATATFSGESASGWQEVMFSQPVAITAGTTYVASYHAPVGRYSVDENYFSSSTDNGPLHALSSTAAGGNGVYAYGSTTTFPNNSYLASNYWVDVVFVQATASDTTPPTVSTFTPAQGATGVATSSAVTATFSEPMTASTITTSTVTITGAGGAAVASTLTYSAATRQVTLQPQAALSGATTYTVTVKGGSSGVKDSAGNALAADRTWTFTTAAAAAGTPTGLTATATTSGVSLDWADLAGASGYNVYRSTSATGTFTRVNTAPTTTSDWDDTMAGSGASHYRVTAVVSGTEGPVSATANATMAKANLLANPSFESGSSPASWTSTSRFTRQAASARSGTYGGRHQTTGNPSYTVGQTVTGLTAGTSYTFAGWVNIPATSDTFTFSLQIQWRNSSNTVLSTQTVATRNAATSGWVKSTGTYTAPSNATRATVNMVTTSFLGPVHVDDFSLR